jgi:Zn-dependent protease with chaperone function
VALLAHELGHFVNGDVRRGPLTGLAFRTFDTLAQITRPERGTARRYGRNTVGIADVFTRMFMGVVHSVFTTIQIVVDAIAVRASHRAEYAADQIAATVGGSEGAAGLFDALLLDQSYLTVMRRVARTETDPQAWRQAIAESAVSMSPRLSRLRQLSMREQASLFRTHPPSGLRAQMAASRSQSSATVVLTEADAIRIDQELAAPYRALRSMLIS